MGRGRGRIDEVWNDHFEAYFQKILKKKKTTPYSKKVSICQRYESWASRRAPSPITHLCSQTYARAQIQLPRLVLLYFLQQWLQYYKSSSAFCFVFCLFFSFGFSIHCTMEFNWYVMFLRLEKFHFENILNDNDELIELISIHYYKRNVLSCCLLIFIIIIIVIIIIIIIIIIFFIVIKSRICCKFQEIVTASFTSSGAACMNKKGCWDNKIAQFTRSGFLKPRLNSPSVNGNSLFPFVALPGQELLLHCLLQLYYPG